MPAPQVGDSSNQGALAPADPFRELLSKRCNEIACSSILGVETRHDAARGVSGPAGYDASAMNEGRCCTLTRRALGGAILSLTTWVMLMPSDAIAGCSHLVTSRADRQRFSSLLGNLSDAIVALDRTMLDIPAKPGSPAPCRGVWCDGRNAPSVPVRSIVVPAESWAWSPCPSDSYASESRRWRPELSPPRPMIWASRPFRPPRHFSSIPTSRAASAR